MLNRGRRGAGGVYFGVFRSTHTTGRGWVGWHGYCLGNVGMVIAYLLESFIGVFDCLGCTDKGRNLAIAPCLVSV